MRRPSSTPFPGACRRLVSRTTRRGPGGRDMDRAISPPALQTRRVTGAGVAPAAFVVNRPPDARSASHPLSGAERRVRGLCRLAPERRARSSPVPGPIGSPRLRLWDERDRSTADTTAASGDPPVPGAPCWLERRRRRRSKSLLVTDNGLVIRRATLDDVPVIRALLAAHDNDSPVTTVDIVGPYVRHLIGHAIALVTERDGELVAYGAALDTGIARHLADLFVRPGLLGRC